MLAQGMSNIYDAVSTSTASAIKQELMEPYYITLQIHRDNTASLSTDVAGVTHGLLGETSLIHNTIICNIA